MMNACFMGLGYIGLPTAIIAAKNGVRITGVDINRKVVDTINQGKIHIVEPGLQDLCSEVVASGMLTARTEPQTSLKSTGTQKKSNSMQRILTVSGTV